MESDDDVRDPASGGGGTGSYWVAVTGLVLLVGIVGFALIRRQDPPPPRPDAPAEKEAGETPPTLIKADVPAILSPEVRIMTERYRCVCGCGDRLSVCTCHNTPGSRDMKAYVEELVNTHKSIGDIDRAMIVRYGELALFSEPEEEPSGESR